MCNNFSRSYLDFCLRAKLKTVKNPLDFLLKNSELNYQAEGYNPYTYGFILDTSSFTNSNKKLYCFVIYCKTTERMILSVSEKSYRDINDCKRLLIYSLKYFPLFAYLKRNKLDFTFNCLY